MKKKKRKAKKDIDIDRAKRLYQTLKRLEKEAGGHPDARLMDKFFLHPERLTTDDRNEIETHIASCGRCRQIQSYYKDKRDSLLAMERLDPCD